MPKYNHITPEHRQLRDLKKRRLQWIEMLSQLRFGSPVAPDVLPGNCQDMLDFLVIRYWPFHFPPQLPRFDTHSLTLESATVKYLYDLLPNEDWAKSGRKPKSLENHPIFLKVDDQLIYLDGRRRLNFWFESNPDVTVKFWVIE